MAGRPRTMARKVDDLCKRMQKYRLRELERALNTALSSIHEYRQDLGNLIPAQYAQDPTPHDEIHATWRASYETALEHHQTVYRLFELLKEKAERAEVKSRSK